MKIEQIKYFSGNDFIVMALGPGFRCTDDDNELLAHETLVEFLPKARDLLRKKGYIADANAINEAFKLEQERT